MFCLFLNILIWTGGFCQRGGTGAYIQTVHALERHSVRQHLFTTMIKHSQPERGGTTLARLFHRWSQLYKSVYVQVCVFTLCVSVSLRACMCVRTSPGAVGDNVGEAMLRHGGRGEKRRGGGGEERRDRRVGRTSVCPGALWHLLIKSSQAVGQGRQMLVTPRHTHTHTYSAGTQRPVHNRQQETHMHTDRDRHKYAHTVQART